MHTGAVRRELHAANAPVCSAVLSVERLFPGLYVEHMRHIRPGCQRDEVVPAPVVLTAGELVLHAVRVLGGSPSALASTWIDDCCSLYGSRLTTTMSVSVRPSLVKRPSVCRAKAMMFSLADGRIVRLW